MKGKGQGALEYLLLIGGAILVAVIVISIIVGLGSGSAGVETIRAAANAQCAKYSKDASCDSIPGTGNTLTTTGADDNVTSASCQYMCNWADAVNRCIALTGATPTGGTYGYSTVGASC